MIKLSALNDESEEDSGNEDEVTREALEQIALQQYAKALELQRKGNEQDATQLLKDLLDTELLYDVKKPAPGEKVAGPLINLKYLCFKNLASMQSASGDIESAIESYCAASELDDTDITLWHRLGQLCMRVKRYEMALHAFQRGAERNPRHWPCLDKIVTLLLGLDFKEECIATIHDTLELDPDYLRGLVYRKHIFTAYPYIRDYMEYLDPIYKWNKDEDEPIDEEKAKALLMEADDIHEIFIEQQRAEQITHSLPDLKLKKPVTNLSWCSVGESLVHMHNYMTENCLSHACYIELIFEKDKQEQPMDVCEEAENEQIDYNDSKPEESNTDNEKNAENVSENENNDMSDKDKTSNDNERVRNESDVEMIPPVVEPVSDLSEAKTQKKNPVRRRGSALSFLQQWEWCKNRRSGRKKTANKQDCGDENIYDTLRRMVPLCLTPDLVQKNEKQCREISPDLEKLFDENEQEKQMDVDYFGSENEQGDVKKFIDKYAETKKDIIDMLKDFLSMLTEKWMFKWPEQLPEIFIEANKCYNNHIDIPTCTGDNNEELLHYATTNILVEEFCVDKKFKSTSNENKSHDLCVIETIGIALSMRPHVFESTNCLKLMLRYLWVKLHIHILNKCEELALDCLYQLVYEFEAMGEHHDTYSVKITNFTHKQTINKTAVLTEIKFLERNKKLSAVMELYERGNYEEVLSIVINSFEHCKSMARNEEEEMSLNFAVQLCLILDTYWALGEVDNCFKWSLTCLHEALKHYFRYTSGSEDYDKWTMAVVKILCCMEHILSTEGLACLDELSQKELSQGLEDLIRIIGHQIETNATDMPFGTVAPWIIMHYILQREEDQGRGRDLDKDANAGDDVSNPLLLLFIAHEQLGNRGWCCNNEGKLLYFTLDIVVPRLRSPSLLKCLDQVCQYMEQCVYCLFGHPSRKNNKLKYLIDHNVTSQTMDWKRAQQVYEIFRPPDLPALEGKVPAITADSEQLFHRILALLPQESDPQQFVSEVEKYIKGIEENLPTVPGLLPYKMKDIYYLLGDYYFKKEEGKMAIKYNVFDVVVNNDRFESWAEISLAKSVNLERLLNSCKNINNEREFLIPAKCIIRCFKRTLELDPTHCNMWIEYGMFVYTVHSFCSRLLKQASESLSMEDFESLEKQKRNMLNTTQKCFTNSNDTDKANEDSWLQYYMLGKVAEKRKKPPSVYLDYYMKGVNSLQETDATYPLKINYSSPTHLCIEVLELHYRIHASILKYIEQHENKPIPASVGKVFMNCIEQWKNGPFVKKPKKDNAPEENDNTVKTSEQVHAANILKRSISDAGEEETHEAKRLKLEAAAAKVRRSASYDTERISKDPPNKNTETSDLTKTDEMDVKEKKADISAVSEKVKIIEGDNRNGGKVMVENSERSIETKKLPADVDDKEDSSSSTSSSSSSDSSSSGSTSDSTDSGKDSDSSKSSNETKNLTDVEIMNIVSSCIDALEDCASRFPPHYKAIYRLAHYHFYYKKGKDIERCRDLMLSNFNLRAGQKLGGLFSERKHSNFFNNIWKIPIVEVDRAGGFAFHMSRSVLLTMEILKEIDDHKTLLDLSLHLQRRPEADKKYLRDSDREELAQQAFSLCVQSLKGQLTKFSQQPDLKSNEVEKQAFNSLMLDIYRAYQRVQRQANSRQLSILLTEGYKLVSIVPVSENTNLVDISMKYCQKQIQKLKAEATLAVLDKNQNAHKKHTAKVAELSKTTSLPNQMVNPTKVDQKVSSSLPSTSNLPKMSPHEMAVAFQNYLPMLNDPILTQQTAAALSLSYLSNLSALASYPTLQNTMQSSLQSTLQNSFQAEFYRQFLGQSLSSYVPPVKKKRGPKPVNAARPLVHTAMPIKTSKSFPGTSVTASKTSSIPIVSHQKPTSTTLTPSMGTVLPSLPASMTANLPSFGGSGHKSSHPPTSTHSHLSSHSHMSSASTARSKSSHQQVSPGKTLQEKLAERQKHLPISSKSEITASINKLPSSLTITKTSVQKPTQKKPEPKKSLPFSEARPKPITSDEVIVLDDD